MATYTEVAEQFNITAQQVITLRGAMSRTWSQVCYDYIDCFEGGEREDTSTSNINRKQYEDHASHEAANQSYCPCKRRDS